MIIWGAAFAGLLIGSYVNVVAHRVPLGKGVVRSRSECPECGHEIAAGDNIPLVSFLLLRGRCRHCGKPISLRYPAVEAGTAIAFGLAAWLIGPSWVLPAYLWATAVVVALVVTDLTHRRIPNRILYPGVAVGTALLAAGAALEGEIGALGRALIGGGAYFGGLLLLAIAARGGFGFGDVKLAFLLGEFTAYRSWGALLTAVMGGFAVGGLIGILLLLARRVGRKDVIAFGPAMTLGAAIGLGFGEAISSWYLGL